MKYLRISWKLFSCGLINHQLPYFVRNVFVKWSETVVINLHIIGNTFINIFIIPVDFGLFAIAESISIVNNRK